MRAKRKQGERKYPVYLVMRIYYEDCSPVRAYDRKLSAEAYANAMSRKDNHFCYYVEEVPYVR